VAGVLWYRKILLGNYRQKGTPPIVINMVKQIWELEGREFRSTGAPTRFANKENGVWPARDECVERRREIETMLKAWTGDENQ